MQLGRHHFDQGAAARRRWFDFYERHDESSSLFRCRKVDFLARGETHVGLLPAALAADGLAEAPLLAFDVQHGDGVHLDLEHQLDRGLDFRLGAASVTRNTYWRYLSAAKKALSAD